MIPGKSHFSIGRSIGQYRPLTRLLPLTVLTTLQIILLFSSKMARPIYASEAPQPGTQQNALQRILSTKVIQGFIPPEEGAPEETTTAGSRREMWCDGDRAPMRSLMPAQNYGLTFAETPTIFMAIPQTTAPRALLVIQNEAGDHNEEMILPIPDADEHGVVSFQFPNDNPLEMGQNYRWSLAIMCQGYLDPSDPFFSGWVQRMERSPEIAQVLNSLSEAEQIEWFSQNGYWYDMLSLMLQN